MSPSWGSGINPAAGSWSSLLVKLNTNSALQWNTFFGSGGNHRGKGYFLQQQWEYSLSWDPAPLPGGSPSIPFPEAEDIYITKLTTRSLPCCGTASWVRPGMTGGSPSLAVDPSGNIYFTGYSGIMPRVPPPLPFPGLNRLSWPGCVNLTACSNEVSFFGPSNYDYGRAIAADKDENIVTATAGAALEQRTAGKSPCRRGIRCLCSQTGPPGIPPLVHVFRFTWEGYSLGF